MNDSEKTKQRPVMWKTYFLTIIVMWTMVISASVLLNTVQIKKNTLKVARIQIRTAFERDVFYRRWNAGHGGVYVPIPMAPLNAIAHANILMLGSGHILIWLIGFSVIVLINHQLNQKDLVRKQAEEELKQSEELLKQTQEISHVGSWSLDLKKNKLTWSDEVYKIFGIKPQEFKASYEAFLEAVHPDDKTIVDQAYITAINNKKPYEIAHRILRPNGEVRDVYEKSMDIIDETGKTIRSIGMVQDITERKKADEALRQAAVFETLTSVLENFISDSLGNLLTPIYGRIELCEIGDNIDQMKNDLGNIKKGITDLITGINAY